MDKRPYFSSLSIKLFAILFGLSAIITIFLTLGIYSQIRAEYYHLLRQELISTASIAASQLNGDELEQIAAPEHENSPAYSLIRQKLLTLQISSQNIASIYTLRFVGSEQYLAFIVDADPTDPAKIGELYDTNLAPAMLDAFIAPSADEHPTTDKWGTTMSGYAPVYNSQGEVVAIVGVDMSIDRVLTQLKDYRDNAFRYALLCMTVAACFSLMLANSLTKRLQKLHFAVNEIAGGNLSVAVAIEGQDEVAYLAAQINSMAAALNNERETMLLATIRGLVNTLEAKDSYTFGHSAEVAELVLDVCHALKLSESETFTIYFAAILHDIGKIGVPDSILNKQGPLTNEEWQYIKQHPSIGARIIADIPALKDVADIVLNHHARYDGSGYPKPLQGEEIPLGARIIAVADSFQAMTSDRSYRRGMPEEIALAELEKCAGTQFDPEIVKVFLERKKLH